MYLIRHSNQKKIGVEYTPDYTLFRYLLFIESVRLFVIIPENINEVINKNLFVISIWKLYSGDVPALGLVYKCVDTDIVS